MTEQRLTELFTRYLQQQTTGAEERELWTAWNEDDPALTPVKAKLIDGAFDNLPVTFPPQATQSADIFNRVMEAVSRKEPVTKKGRVLPTSSPFGGGREGAEPSPFRTLRIWHYAAAIILLLSVGAYLWFNTPNPKPSPITKVQPVKIDVPPGGNKATLKLADGTIIVLDSAANGSLAMQGNAKIIKLPDGQIAYSTDGVTAAEVLYNTMSTPRGGQYRLTLPDGTQVWLNAASSITFPTAFVAKERRVAITGEVYLEVAKNKDKPFIVDADGKTTVEVLGTHFNINSYTDETSINTTLIEGSVMVTANGQQVTLKPGQQAQASEGQLSVKALRQTEIAKAIAWKEGRFNFQDANLEEIMRQLSRWYDIDVVYEQGIPDLEFIGEIERSLPLSEVLKGLKMSGVNFRLEKGKRLIIYP